MAWLDMENILSYTGQSDFRDMSTICKWLAATLVLYLLHLQYTYNYTMLMRLCISVVTQKNKDMN